MISKFNIIFINLFRIMNIKEVIDVLLTSCKQGEIIEPRHLIRVRLINYLNSPIYCISPGAICDLKMSGNTENLMLMVAEF